MPLWGESLSETFQVGFSGPQLTSDYVDNRKIARLSGSTASVSSKFDQAFVYVKYTKGSEDGIDVLASFSRVEDQPPGEDFFDEVIRDDATSGLLEDRSYRMATSGTKRIPLQIGKSEDRLMVSVRGFGAAAQPYTGVVELFFGLG